MSVELVAELDASQNLNTSPFTVSNMEGDKYDYHFITFCDSASTTSGNLSIRYNSDTGANYDIAYMNGTTTTASAFVNTQTSIPMGEFTRNQSGRNALLMGVLTGSSGNQRPTHLFSSSGYSPRLDVRNAYWTNTVDEVTSMTFTGSTSASYTWHIMVYRVPKVSDHGRFEHMADLSWSAETAEKSFTVDGDRDIQYKIEVDIDQNINLECNNDAGSNYVKQQIYNQNGTLTAANSTTTSASAQSRQVTYLINAESGVDRLIHSSGSKTASAQQLQNVYWWQNTGSNLTSLDLTPDSSATGTAKLYRRINTATTADPLPFETIKTIDVSGDYSAGTTVSGLALDQYKLVKIELLIDSGATNTDLLVQLNGDTASNYTRQYLRAQVSSTSAGTSTIAHFQLNLSGNNEKYSCMYIYPKSGEYRPALTRSMGGQDAIDHYAAWWANTADEITSIKTYASTTASMSGKIIISVLR